MRKNIFQVRFWLYNKIASKNQYELLDESVLDCFFDAKNDLDYDKPCKGRYKIF